MLGNTINNLLGKLWIWTARATDVIRIRRALWKKSYSSVPCPFIHGNWMFQQPQWPHFTSLLGFWTMHLGNYQIFYSSVVPNTPCVGLLSVFLPFKNILWYFHIFSLFEAHRVFFPWDCWVGFFLVICGYHACCCWKVFLRVRTDGRDSEKSAAAVLLCRERLLLFTYELLLSG